MRKHVVLVVDDEPAIVRLVRAKLQSDGRAVISANSGEEALKDATGAQISAVPEARLLNQAVNLLQNGRGCRYLTNPGKRKTE